MFDWLKNIFAPNQDVSDNIIDKQAEDSVDEELDTNFAKGSPSDNEEGE
ncbi:hypothetical protein L4D09_27010 [Photobacterium makurazakiensis]